MRIAIIPSLYDNNRYFLFRENYTEVSFEVRFGKIRKLDGKISKKENQLIEDNFINIQTYESKINRL